MNWSDMAYWIVAIVMKLTFEVMHLMQDLWLFSYAAVDKISNDSMFSVPSVVAQHSLLLTCLWVGHHWLFSVVWTANKLRLVTFVLNVMTVYPTVSIAIVAVFHSVLRFYLVSR